MAFRPTKSPSGSGVRFPWSPFAGIGRLVPLYRGPWKVHVSAVAAIIVANGRRDIVKVCPTHRDQPCLSRFPRMVMSLLFAHLQFLIGFTVAFLSRQTFVSRVIGNGTSQRLLVIGAGVSGLTSALCLIRKGFEVTLVADRLAPRVTSVVAGALWEWPPAVCGFQQDQVSLNRSKVWSAISYDAFTELAGDTATGVFLRPATYYFKHPIDDDPRERQKVAELRGSVRRFRLDPALITANGINPALGLRDAYTLLAPMIDTDVYMRWLEGEVRPHSRLPGD